MSLCKNEKKIKMGERKMEKTSHPSTKLKNRRTQKGGQTKKSKKKTHLFPNKREDKRKRKQHLISGGSHDQADAQRSEKSTFQMIYLQFFVIDIVSISLGNPKTGFGIS
jgi:hypothetical protein